MKIDTPSPEVPVLNLEAATTEVEIENCLDTTSHNSANGEHIGDAETEHATLDPLAGDSNSTPFELVDESTPAQAVDEDPTSPQSARSDSPDSAAASHEEAVEIPVELVELGEVNPATETTPATAQPVEESKGREAALGESQGTAAKPVPKTAPKKAAAPTPAFALTKVAPFSMPPPLVKPGTIPDKHTIDQASLDAAKRTISAFTPTFQDMARFLIGNLGISMIIAVLALIMTVNLVATSAFSLRRRHRTSPMGLITFICSESGGSKSTALTHTIEILLRLIRERSVMISSPVSADFSIPAFCDRMIRSIMKYIFIYDPDARFLLRRKLLKASDDGLHQVFLKGFCGELYIRERKNVELEIPSLKTAALLATQTDFVEELFGVKEFVDAGVLGRSLFAHEVEGGDYEPYSDEEAAVVVKRFTDFLDKSIDLLVPLANGELLEITPTAEVTNFLDALHLGVELKRRENQAYPWRRRQELVHRLAATMAVMDLTELAKAKGINVFVNTPVILEKHLHAGLALVEASELYAGQFLPAAFTRPVPVPKVNSKWAKALEILRDNGGSMAKAELAKRVPFSPPNMKDFLAECDEVEECRERKKTGRGAPTKMVRLKPSAEGVGQQTPSGESGPSSQPAGEELDDLTL